MVTRIRPSRILLPRNFSFAKAKPARVEMSTTETVTVVATMAELIRPVAK